MYRLRLSKKLLGCPEERERLRQRGLDYFSVFFGPATGPKFTVTAGFERAFLEQPWTGLKWFVGGSAGAMRFTSMLLTRITGLDFTYAFEKAYCGIGYRNGDSAAQITKEFQKVLDIITAPAAVDKLLANDEARLMILVSRIRKWSASLSQQLYKLSYAPFFVTNPVHSGSQRWLYERLCFYTGPDVPHHLFSRHESNGLIFSPLTKDNFRQVLHASCAIPMIIDPVQHIEGVGPGLYVDGGLGDYQLNCCVEELPALLLSHSGIVKATWFDKWVPMRAPPAAYFDNCSIIYPSWRLLWNTPARKVPARGDWQRWDKKPAKRIEEWLGAIAASEEHFPRGDLLSACAVDKAPIAYTQLVETVRRMSLRVHAPSPSRRLDADISDRS